MRRSTIALEDDQNFVEIVYEPPAFQRGTDYYSKFWTSFVENERILGEIQSIAQDNLKSLTAIYNMEDFYENNLLPKMFAFPHQYVARIIANNNRAKGGQMPQGGLEAMGDTGAAEKSQPDLQPEAAVTSSKRQSKANKKAL